MLCLVNKEAEWRLWEEGAGFRKRKHVPLMCTAGSERMFPAVFLGASGEFDSEPAR